MRKLAPILSSFLLHGHTAPLKGRFNRFGMTELIKIIADKAYNKPGSLGWDSTDGYQKLSKKLESFFSFFETDFCIIRKKQKLFKRLIADEKLVTFLLEKKYPTLPDGRHINNPENSSLNDSMAVATVEYFKTLSTLFGTTPEYAHMRKTLKAMYQKNSWMKQMEFLSESSTNSHGFTVKTEIECILDDHYNKDHRDYRYDSASCAITFVVNDTPVTTFSRIDGTFDTRTSDDKKTIVCSVSVNQRSAMFKRSVWEKLLIAALTSNGVKSLLALKKEDVLTLNITIKASAAGKISAVVSVDGKEPKKFSFKRYFKKGRTYSEEDWVVQGARCKVDTQNKILSDNLDTLVQLRMEHVFATSRKFIYSYVDDFREIYEKMDELVMLASIANYYNEYKNKWVFPTVLPTTSMVTNITAGINPLLFEKTKDVVPNDAIFSKKKNAFLITGANTGGKTAFTNMIALNQMLAQAGLPVFAKEARLSMKDKILCHYVESEDVGVNLSRYQSELHRLGVIIEEVTPHSLVLFDEPFSGTSVESGTGQAHAVLRALSKVGCSFIMNTHFHGLVDIVGVNGTSNVTNLHFVLPNTETPGADDYKALAGGIKISYGEAIAMVEKVDYKSMMYRLRKRKILTKNVKKV